MNSLKKTDFNFNYICATAYRTLLLLKYLLIKNLTRQEIIEIFDKDEFVPQRITSENIRLMLNSLKEVGCEIPRPSKNGRYEYKIVKNPFSLSLSNDEIKLINKFTKKPFSKNDWQGILDTNSFIDKICLITDDEKTKEILKNNKLLSNIDLNLIKEIDECCKNKSTVIFKYISNRKVSDFEMITSFIKYEKNNLYVWGYSTKYKEFSYLRFDKIKSLQVKEKYSKKAFNNYVIRYEMYDLNYELNEDEVLVQKTDNLLVIDYNLQNKFYVIQKFLEMGVDCKIISPKEFKEEFVASVKSIKEVYSDV